MRVLVTGADGFIGSAICRDLEAAGFGRLGARSDNPALDRNHGLGWRALATLTVGLAAVVQRLTSKGGGGGDGARAGRR